MVTMSLYVTMCQSGLSGVQSNQLESTMSLSLSVHSISLRQKSVSSSYS